MLHLVDSPNQGAPIFDGVHLVNYDSRLVLRIPDVPISTSARIFDDHLLLLVPILLWRAGDGFGRSIEEAGTCARLWS